MNTSSELNKQSYKIIHDNFKLQDRKILNIINKFEIIKEIRYINKEKGHMKLFEEV